MSPGNAEGRPRQETASLLATPSDTDFTPRCRTCKHPLRAPRSVRRGLGPVCAVRSRGTAGMTPQPLSAVQADSVDTWQQGLRPPPEPVRIYTGKCPFCWRNHRLVLPAGYRLPLRRREDCAKAEASR